MFPRVQWFEFNDAPWVPESLRETIVVALSNTLRMGRMLDGVVEPFSKFLQAAGTHEVLDLCAGAGGPAAILSDALHERAVPARFTLTDLFPHVETWSDLIDEREGRLDFVGSPVDATSIPPELGAGRARLMVNALHHFPPEVAKRVLLAACADAPGVFIVEGLDRNLFSFAAMGPMGVAGLYSTPFTAQHRLKSMLLTWASPVALACSMWDGSVSCLRAYPEATLRQFVAELDGWQWDFGTYRHNGFGQGTYFSGLNLKRGIR